MSSGLAILLPVLGRPHRVAPVLASIRSATPEATPVFVCSPGDHAEREAVARERAACLTVRWQPGPGDYARKINLAFRRVVGDGEGPVPYGMDDHAEWVFLGADDLVFRRGWLEACMRRHQATGACVIGTNDLGNSRTIVGRHSTHTLVHADYLECGTADRAGMILHEGYDHQFCDDELVQTAMWRGTFQHARSSVVEHLHPAWGKAKADPTYAKAERRVLDDRDLYLRRKHLWGK